MAMPTCVSEAECVDQVGQNVCHKNYLGFFDEGEKYVGTAIRLLCLLAACFGHSQNHSPSN